MTLQLLWDEYKAVSAPKPSCHSNLRISRVFRKGNLLAGISASLETKIPGREEDSRSVDLAIPIQSSGLSGRLPSEQLVGFPRNMHRVGFSFVFAL